MTRFPFPIPEQITEMFDDGVNARVPKIADGIDRYSAVRGAQGTYSTQPVKWDRAAGRKMRTLEDERDGQIDTVRQAALIRNGQVQVLQNETAGFSVLVRLNASGVLAPSGTEEVYIAIENALRQDYGGQVLCDLIDARTYWTAPGQGEHLLTIRCLCRGNGDDNFNSPQSNGQNRVGGQG